VIRHTGRGLAAGGWVTVWTGGRGLHVGAVVVVVGAGTHDTGGRVGAGSSEVGATRVGFWVDTTWGGSSAGLEPLTSVTLTWRGTTLTAGGAGTPGAGVAGAGGARPGTGATASGVATCGTGHQASTATIPSEPPPETATPIHAKPTSVVRTLLLIGEHLHVSLIVFIHRRTEIQVGQTYPFWIGRSPTTFGVPLLCCHTSRTGARIASVCAAWSTADSASSSHMPCAFSQTDW
jgi:hypothetical protein